MKLYFTPRTRAIRARWVLEELEVPYDLVMVDPAKQEHLAPSYLALHPFGEVPALVDGDVTLFESSSICLYLADRFPEKQLAPPVGDVGRGEYYQWLLFAEVSIEPALTHRARLGDMLRVVEERLATGPHLVGGRFTAADLVMASILHRAHALRLLDGHPRLFEYVLLHVKRPALRRALG